MSRPKRKNFIIGSLNVNGFRSSAEAVAKLIKRKNIDILVLSEIKLPLQYSFPRGRQYEAICKGISKGGLAISIKSDIVYKHIFDEDSDDHQAIAIKVEDLTIVGLYIRPGTKVAKINEIMDSIKAKTQGRIVIMGDLNARHTNWCKKSNNQGKALWKWTKNFWRIQAPDSPTYYPSKAHQGSVLDIAVTHRCADIGTRTITGDWDGSTDHLAIMAKVPAQWVQTQRKKRITMARRKKEELIEAAGDHYRQHLSTMAGKFDDATSDEALNKNTLELINKLLTGAYEGNRSN